MPASFVIRHNDGYRATPVWPHRQIWRNFRPVFDLYALTHKQVIFRKRYEIFQWETNRNWYCILNSDNSVILSDLQRSISTFWKLFRADISKKTPYIAQLTF